MADRITRAARLAGLWIAALMFVVTLGRAAPASTTTAPAGQVGDEPDARFTPLADRSLDNLVAMTRLLGYVRFFHPLETYHSIDWNAVAIDGAELAEGAHDAAQLAERLESWIRDTAPTVRVRAASAGEIQQAIENGDGGDELIDASLRRPKVDASVKVLAWRHHGINLAGQRGPYFSRLDETWLDADEQPAPEKDPAQPMVLDLGGGVCALVPRFLYESPDDQQDADAPVRADVSVLDRAVRFADVALTWTVLQHFYPYFDVVDADWDAQLATALTAAATDRNSDEFHDTLRRLVAGLDDGHGNVYRQGDSNWFVPPVVIGRVEGKWVVTHSLDPSLEAGDIIRAVAGEPVDEVANRLAETISAAHDGWKRHRLSQGLLLGPMRSQVVLQVENLAGEKSVRLERSVHVMQMLDDPHEVIEEVEPGVWYVDLDRATDQQVKDAMDELAQATGVIFDMRGYPNNLSTIVISHLIDEPITCAQWHVPIVTKPDRRDMQFRFSNWKVQPMQPRITGNVAFIIDGSAISYAETYMGIIEHYKLAETVGEPTAGTNGNVIAFQLPGDYHVAFTGMKVLKHDGSQHHGIGILPTVPCTRTLEGIRAGKDELLQRAIDVVNEK